MARSPIELGHINSTSKSHHSTLSDQGQASGCDFSQLGRENQNHTHPSPVRLPQRRPLYWYGKQLSATCVTWSRHGLVTRPYRTGGDELAVIVEAAKSVNTDNRRREFVAQVQSFVQELATITKDVGAEPGNTISDEKETTTSTSSEPRAQAEHLKPGLLVPDEAKAPAAVL